MMLKKIKSVKLSKYVSHFKGNSFVVLHALEGYRLVTG